MPSTDSDRGDQAVPGGPLFTVSAVARVLAVQPSTLRTWDVCHGLGPTAHTRGGARRYTPADVQRLRRVVSLMGSGMTVQVAAGTVGALPTPHTHIQQGSRISTDRLTAAMGRLDADAVSAVAAKALHTMGAATAWVRLFAPALVAVGADWEATGCGIEVENLTSGLIEAALRAHIAEQAKAPSGSNTVILAAVPGEEHTLPLTALAAALAETGHTGLLLGALPEEALRAAVARCHPTAVVLWSTASHLARPGWLEAAARHQWVQTILPAGPGWMDSPFDHLTSLSAALDRLRSPQGIQHTHVFHDPYDHWID